MGKWLYDTEEEDIGDEDPVPTIGQSGGEDNQKVEPRVQA
jgi:hypothetical protein